MPNQSCRSERSLLCPSSVAGTRERTVRSTVSVGRRVAAAVVPVIRTAVRICAPSSANRHLHPPAEERFWHW